MLLDLQPYAGRATAEEQGREAAVTGGPASGRRPGGAAEDGAGCGERYGYGAGCRERYGYGAGCGGSYGYGTGYRERYECETGTGTGAELAPKKVRVQTPKEGNVKQLDKEKCTYCWYMAVGYGAEY